MFLIIIGVVIVAFWIYVGFIRGMLARTWPKTWAWLDDIEGKLWRHSRTILASRLYWIGGIIVAVHDMASSAGMDWTPLTTEIASILDPKWRPLALAGFMIMTGLLFEWLKRTAAQATTNRVE